MTNPTTITPPELPSLSLDQRTDIGDILDDGAEVGYTPSEDEALLFFVKDLPDRRERTRLHLHCLARGYYSSAMWWEYNGCQGSDPDVDGPGEWEPREMPWQ